MPGIGGQQPSHHASAMGSGQKWCPARAFPARSGRQGGQVALHPLKAQQRAVFGKQGHATDFHHQQKARGGNIAHHHMRKSARGPFTIKQTSGIFTASAGSRIPGRAAPAAHRVQTEQLFLLCGGLKVVQTGVDLPRRCFHSRALSPCGKRHLLHGPWRAPHASAGRYHVSWAI